MKSFLMTLASMLHNLATLRVLVMPSKQSKTWVIGQKQGQGFVDEYLKLIANGVSTKDLGAPRLVMIVTSSGFLKPWFSKIASIVVVNLEHTLVLPGGRDSSGAVSGQVPSIHDESEKYLVRLPQHSAVFQMANAIVDYSKPNISNVLLSSLSAVYQEKVVYIAPLLRTRSYMNRSNRDVSTVYTIMGATKDRDSDRRMQILDQITGRCGIAFQNITDLSSSADMRLESMGILLNLHQTDHHHTLEELRILPALLSGVLVVSEPSPLVERVPYGKFVKFAELDRMPDVLLGLVENFETEWDSTFGDGCFVDTVSALHDSNSRSFDLIGKQLRLRRNNGR